MRGACRLVRAHGLITYQDLAGGAWEQCFDFKKGPQGELELSLQEPTHATRRESISERVTSCAERSPEQVLADYNSDFSPPGGVTLSSARSPPMRQKRMRLATFADHLTRKFFSVTGMGLVYHPCR